jgi:hypothetical protein
VVLEQRLKEQNHSQLYRFIEMRVRIKTFTKVFSVLRGMQQKYKERDRVAKYFRNAKMRDYQQVFFRKLREVTHIQAQERIKREMLEYKQRLETEKLTMWTSKVDQLMLYMA